jgi:hypothetical protein
MYLFEFRKVAHLINQIGTTHMILFYWRHTVHDYVMTK